MRLASSLAEAHHWEVIKELPRPFLSSAIADDTQGRYSETCNMQMMAKDGSRRLDLLFNWNDIVASLSWRVDPIEVGGVNADKWESRSVSIHDSSGNNIREKYIHMLNMKH